MDIDKAMISPASAFADPMAVCNSSELTHEQKVEILRRWEYDARELQVAAEENMTGGDSVVLEDVLAALKHLGASAEQSPPTKQ